MDSVVFQSSSLRLRIIFSYWLVFLAGIPLWWVTTSIQRLALPVDRVRSTVSASELHFSLDVLIQPPPEELQINITRVARQVGGLFDEIRKKYPSPWNGLEVNVQDAPQARARKPRYKIELHPSSASSGVRDEYPLWITDRSLHVRIHDLAALPSILASSLSGLLTPHSEIHSGRTSQGHLVARYAPKYRLAFSLLNEDAAAGGAVRGWDIQAGIKHHLSPVLSQLSVLHNFTVESQVQFHAPLAFEPPVSETAGKSYLLGEEELKMFVNSADWTLASSVSEDPVLHFILFVPSMSHRPLRIQALNGAHSDAFIVPQWGGVVILDPSRLPRWSEEALSENSVYLSPADLASALQTFHSQLLTLIGLSPLPPSIAIPGGMPALSEWQLDALLRQRALENTRDSKAALASIVKLVEQIENMPVGQDVRGDVQGALDAIEQVYASASASPHETLRHSARAHELSSRAFFNPGMLALLYFPAEHKYAVYIPLFAPVAVPLVAAAAREFRRWGAERKKQEREKVE